ncbi:hypothetical protein AB0E63_10710 [Kribbella sp. NPDC026596]|uniref:hypothetical protein n=1 Tax=Kribbella sp. NPDC026596 TaxID=3155122 RepID=UPI0033CB5F91
MTAELAARWAGTVVPSWLYRWLMPVGWVAALVVSIASDDRPCSVTDPTVCGPDRTFSLAMIACFASLVLWWWRPRLAATAGLLFLVLELRYDDVAGARTAWTVYAAGCAVLLIWLVLGHRRQRALTAELPRRPVMVPGARPPGFTGRLGVAAVLVLVGAAAWGVMNWQTQREEAHIWRAIEQTAVADGHTDDGDLRLKLPDGSTSTATVIDDYPPGTRVPVLIDPVDRDWIRLQAEPSDYTPWYTVAGGAWALAILLVLRDLGRRRARPRQAWRAEALPIRIAPDASGLFAISSTDGVLLGFVNLELDDEEADERLFAAIDGLDDEDDAPAAVRQEWTHTLRRYRGDALLVGDLAEGSWPTVLIGDVPLRPIAPLRGPRRTPWSRESVDSIDLGADDSSSGPPPATGARLVDPAREIPELPWSLPLEPAAWWHRPALAGVLLAAPIAVPTPPGRRRATPFLATEGLHTVVCVVLLLVIWNPF